MFKRMMLPLDGSQMAESVLAQALALAQLTQAEVYVLHVLSETQDESVDPMQWYLRKAAAQAYLDTVYTRLRDAELETTCLMLAGNPTERIIDYIERSEIDLMVISAHGESGRNDGSLGAVAYKLLEGMSISTLLVPHMLPADEGTKLAPAEYTKVFVPLDGSRRAECVLPIAEQLAAAHGATLILAHVLQHPAIFGWSALQEEDQQSADALLARSQQKAESYLADVQARMGENTQVLLSAADNTAMELSHLIEVEGADLLLLSAHGAASNPRRAFGDTLRSLLNYVRVPVLIYQDRPVIRMQAAFDAPQRNSREGVLDLEM